MSPNGSRHWKDLRLQHVMLNSGHVLENRLTEMTQLRPGTKVGRHRCGPAPPQMARLLSHELIPVHELLPTPAPQFQPYAVRAFPDLGATQPLFAVYGHPDYSQLECTQAMDRPIPLVTFAVGVEGDTARLWQYLCRLIAREAMPFGNPPGPGIHDTIDPASPPPAPWCGVGLHLALLLGAYPDALHWLGAFERCVAWAVVLHARAIADPIVPG